MIKKVTANGVPGSALFDLAAAVKASPHPIWLAGLGALAKAGTEGGKAFEALVKEGQRLQKKTRGVAEERLGETPGRLSELLQSLNNRTSGSREKFERLLEDGVARVQGRLGVPTAKDLAALVQRLDAVEQQLASLGVNRPKSVGSSASKVAKGTPTRKSAHKSALVPAKVSNPKRAGQADSPKAPRSRKGLPPANA
ncbi:phasin family protein [Curvibacter sp. RS43]|uniref:phasin family protein n=1 Tax=Curvibacter microcysteis TaxID=3026419 RepID=UPI002360441C|nr:phasin family protein [Curvibacter sp. RS43]MDD0810226.1 phasin family protein [Curvibacter sp. RS43]